MTIKLLGLGFAGYLVAMLPLRAIASPAVAADGQMEHLLGSALDGLSVLLCLSCGLTSIFAVLTLAYVSATADKARLYLFLTPCAVPAAHAVIGALMGYGIGWNAILSSTVLGAMFCSGIMLSFAVPAYFINKSADKALHAEFDQKEKRYLRQMHRDFIQEDLAAARKINALSQVVEQRLEGDRDA